MTVARRVVAGIAMGSMAAGIALGVSAPATAGTKPPPCTKAAVKRALRALTATLPPDATISAFTKVCQGYWAGGGYEFTTPDGGGGSSSYLLQASGGRWKLVPYKKHVSMCSKGSVPKKVRKRACKMAP